MTTNGKGYIQIYYKRNRNLIIQALGGRCCRCFTIHNLEIHHLNPVNWGSGRGRIDRLTEWRRAIQETPTNIGIECTDCHQRSGYG